MHFTKYKSILSPKNGMNIYRGCAHGCIYCDSRSKCYEMKHDFEDIEVKTDAPAMLSAELMRKRKKCMIATGAMCDPYTPPEQELKYTRACLEAIEQQGFGVSILTKSDLILRDLDLLKKINERAKCVVQLTLTTYDEALCKIIEPNVCTTRRRFEVLQTLRDNQIPTVVWFTPLLPFINDTEENVRGILSYCKDAGVYGVICFGMGVTLREGDREYFYSALDRDFPGLKEKYHKTFGYAYECSSPRRKELMRLFHKECTQNQIECDIGKIFHYLSTMDCAEQPVQLSLFDDL